jgi:hypothetical protein
VRFDGRNTNCSTCRVTLGECTGGLSFVELRKSADSLSCYSDYTLHTHPAPAQPSHRLLPALRLLHTPIPAKTVDAYVEQPYFPAQSYSLTLADWLDTLSGMKEAMSEEIETNVKKSLVELCELVEQDAEEGLLSLETKRSRLKETTDGSNEGMDAVRRLWESQQRVGRLVSSSVRAGTAF